MRMLTLVWALALVPVALGTAWAQDAGDGGPFDAGPGLENCDPLSLTCSNAGMGQKAESKEEIGIGIDTGAPELTVSGATWLTVGEAPAVTVTTTLAVELPALLEAVTVKLNGVAAGTKGVVKLAIAAPAGFALAKTWFRGQRVAFLDRGRIVALDTPTRLKAEYGKDDKTTLEDIFIQLTGSDLRKESEVL